MTTVPLPILPENSLSASTRLALFCAVEFPLFLGTQKSDAPNGLYGLVVGELPHLHQITVAAYGSWIHVLQSFLLRRGH